MSTLAAVVATYHRPRLLKSRALAAVAKQTRPPDVLIVVDDSTTGVRNENRAVVDGISAGHTQVIYLENQRTPGACGSWSTALFELHRIYPSAFVAILDDDDMWEPTYLQRCEQTTLERDLHMVATGIIFNHTAEGEGLLLRSPASLDVDDLLVRNSHIQGSNLFVRLHKLLEAGGFDESLTSTTDRDICIRLADLNTVRYGRIQDCLVQHYAESGRPRLSTPGSDAKSAGLTEFYRKYRARMDERQREAFIRRSLDVFGCDPTAAVVIPPTQTAVRQYEPTEDHLYLVVGATTSQDVRSVMRLMDSLLAKTSNRSDVSLKVVLLENGLHDDESRAALTDSVSKMTRRGLEVSVMTLERQAKDVASGVLSATPGQMSGRKSIALSRTMLQHYLFLAAKPIPGAVAWILDDDVLLEGLVSGDDGSTHVLEIDYVSAVKRLKQANHGIVIGEVTGDPPLPVLSCVRTQLVDLYHNLHQLANLSPDDAYPDRLLENRLQRLKGTDYYDDLSVARSDHLESPFWYKPSNRDKNAAQVLDEMTRLLPEVLAGRQVFRPLVSAAPAHPGAVTGTYLNRGPNTLVFDMQALREFPNAVPTIKGSDTRRSDMIWSLLNHVVSGRSVVQAHLPVRQVREADTVTNDHIGTLIDDTRGHALFSALREVLKDKSEGRQLRNLPAHTATLLDLDETEIERALELYKSYLLTRAHVFELNFIRIQGLLSALRPFHEGGDGQDKQPWWLGSTVYVGTADRLRTFAEDLRAIYTDENLVSFRRRLLDGGTQPVRSFLLNLPETVARHRRNTPLPKEQLTESAETYVNAEFKTGDLSCLGIGEEAVVLTDGHLVYKHFHYWKPSDRGARLAFLRSLASRLSGFDSLPNIQEVHVRGDRLVVTYPYEPGTVYCGGHLEELLTLMRECREAGISCRNIHPDNLLVSENGLKLIDIGFDVVPYSDEEFEQMCRRAYLTYRSHYRSDLKRLMTKSLTDEDMPELTGIDLFRRAVDPRGLDELFYRPLAKLVTGSDPTKFLDYGCGDGRLAELVAQQGAKVTAYDPDVKVIAECRERTGMVEYVGDEEFRRLLDNSEKFDNVVCSRVLCTIDSAEELHTTLRNIRRLVEDSGEVTVAVCNPLHITTVSTELGGKCVSEGHSYHDTFSYTKHVSSSGGWRQDVHRSLSTYRQAFANSGLRVKEVLELDGVDTQEMLPASDHLVFRLLPAPTDGPRVSLLIKTCLMEWRTIERMVCHQVRQLEEPVGFAEKVIVVDPFEGPFSRQYERPDAQAHRAAMKRLLDDGVVNRIIYAPTEPDATQDTYRRWFGADSVETHSANGQQLFTTLFGFEACEGDYVLQLDSDLLITRRDTSHDYLTEMVDVLRRDPAALFASMSICVSKPIPYSAKGPRGDWRVEVRGCLFDRQRLLSALPIKNRVEDGRLLLPWHRAFDNLIAGSDYRSYRGGNPGIGFIHVPNEFKKNQEALLDIVDSVARGHVPESQLDSVELRGSSGDWAGPKRREPVVFIICGRDVHPGRFKRCIESLEAQANRDWGAVVVDDASTNGFGDYAEVLLSAHADRVTLLRNSVRKGLLFNTWNAITQYCSNPRSVIVTLDADDALLGPRVLDRVLAEYEDGADVTVGSMLRLDKEAEYPVDFDSPRSRSSNVWQHLRTFRKYLFDAICVEDLMIDGVWIELANDWAFMVPIVEMSINPRHITEKLYQYEPASPKDDRTRRQRDRVIARILEKPAYEKWSEPLSSPSC